MPIVCEEIGCLIFPTYGIPGEKPKYYKKHKYDKMKYIYKKNFCDVCKIVRATYGIKGDKIPTRCKNHKDDNMVDVFSKLCIVCKKYQPNFNYPGEKYEYCKKCKKEGMIDVRCKKCLCGLSQPNYAYEGKRAICCKKCKKEGMVDTRHLGCLCGLVSNPCFGYIGKQPICCVKCKKDDMVDIKNKLCMSNYPPYSFDCPIQRKYKHKYDGFCANCFSHLFPNDERTEFIRKKSKELKVVNYVSSRIAGFYHDKPLYVNLEDPGCDCSSKRRIDLRKIIGNTLLCIEVDENQHKYYCKVDEEKRYNELVMDFTGKYIFIRFNPDKYIDKNGKTKNPLLKNRLPLLLNEINNQIKKINNEENNDLFEIKHMYYDET